MIVAEQLTKSYGARIAVDHVSFHVPRGEVVGFLGPNGAGKSTTLRMVAGFLPPSSGSIRVAGLDVVDDSLQVRQKLGYMPESVPLYPEMRVDEYLAFRAEIKGVRSGRKDAVNRAMEQADVMDVSRRLIGELSKGYRQRVGLADALVATPDLLILDEPTAGLDPNQILHVRELIKGLGKTHTIFLSTHILPEVEAVCSRVVIIARGKIAAEGTADEIRGRLEGSGRAATLTVRGDDARIREALAKVSGAKIIGEPTRIESGTDTEGAAVFRFDVEIDEGKESAGAVAERLACACVENGFGMRGLDVRGKSLESIFHALTTTDAAAIPKDDAGERPATGSDEPNGNAGTGATP